MQIQSKPKDKQELLEASLQKKITNQKLAIDLLTKKKNEYQNKFEELKNESQELIRQLEKQQEVIDELRKEN